MTKTENEEEKITSHKWAINISLTIQIMDNSDNENVRWLTVKMAHNFWLLPNSKSQQKYKQTINKMHYKFVSTRFAFISFRFLLSNIFFLIVACGHFSCISHRSSSFAPIALSTSIIARLCRSFFCACSSHRFHGAVKEFCCFRLTNNRKTLCPLRSDFYCVGQKCNWNLRHNATEQKTL